MTDCSWNNLRHEIRARRLGHHPIMGFAALAGARWPKDRAGETFDLYLDDDRDALQARDGFGAAKVDWLRSAAAHVLASSGCLQRDGQALSCQELSALVEECGGISGVIAQSDWDAWGARCGEDAPLASGALAHLHRRWPEGAPSTLSGFPEATAEIDALKGWGPKKVGLLAGTVAAMAGAMEPRTARRIDDGLGDLSAADALRALVDRLVHKKLMTGDRLTEVVSLYYGCGDHQKPTLRQVGAQVRITGERVRQIVRDFRDICSDLGGLTPGCLNRLPEGGILTAADRHGVLGGQSLLGHARLLRDVGFAATCFSLTAARSHVIIQEAGTDSSESLCFLAATGIEDRVAAVLDELMSAMLNQGLIPVDEIERSIRQRFGREPRGLMALIRGIPEGHEVPCEGEAMWWWLANRHNQIYARAQMALTARGEIEIGELAEAVERSIRKTLPKPDRRTYPTTPQVEAWLRVEKACDSGDNRIRALNAPGNASSERLRESDRRMLAAVESLDYPQTYRDLFRSLESGLTSSGRTYSKAALDNFVFKSPFFTEESGGPEKLYRLIGGATPATEEPEHNASRPSVSHETRGARPADSRRNDPAMTQQAQHQVNPHVEQMREMCASLDAAVKGVVTELQTETPSLLIETKSIEFVAGQVRNPRSRLILLTGNAGHGKTFLCERVLERVTEKSGKDLKDLLTSDEVRDAGVEVAGRRIRIHTDLSELNEKGGARYLEDAWRRTSNDLTIVCLNEGKLRSVLRELQEGIRQKLSEALDRSIKEGLASTDAELVLLNLNFQSVTVSIDNGPSAIERVLEEWCLDEAKWSDCGDCSARGNCPILRNRTLLAGAGGERRRAGMRDLLQITERIGHVTTMRDLLMLVAYSITGGLRCRDVQSKRRRESNAPWEWKHSFHRCLFGVDLRPEQLEKQPLLRALRRLDPGLRSIREVDDKYVVGIEAEDGVDLCVKAERDQAKQAATIAAGTQVNSTGSETGSEEEEALSEAIRTLRRRDFFDLWQHSPHRDRSDLDERARRLGFQYISDLIWLQEDSSSTPDPKRKQGIKRELIRGLNALQGHRVTKDKKLLIGHAAFSTWPREAKLISHEVSAGEVDLRARPTEWRDRSNAVSINDTVDTTPPGIFICIGEDELLLDLSRFEYIRRAGRGFLARNFFSRDIRRISNFLAGASDSREQSTAGESQLAQGLAVFSDETFQFEIADGLIQ